MNNKLLVSRHSKIRALERLIGFKEVPDILELEFVEKLLRESIIIELHPQNESLDIHKFRLEGYPDFVAICERKDNEVWLVKTIVDKFVKLKQGN
jgi:hypothetical protein